MTLPPSLSELDDHLDGDQDLSRVSLLVGGLLLDIGIPTDASIASIIGDVIELATDQLPVRSDQVDVEFDDTEDKWTFARLGGDAIDPNRSLGEAGIYDGELLLIREVDTPAAPMLFDDVVGVAPGAADRRVTWLAANRWRLAWFAVSGLLAAMVGLMLPGQNGVEVVPGWPIAAIATLVVGLGFGVAACVVPYRSPDGTTSAWLAGVALPLMFAGAMFVVPGAHGVKALPMALALVALLALLQLLISGRGRALYTAVVAVSVLAIPSALAELLLNPPPRAIGAVLATVAVIVVYLAPRVTIGLSKLPVPRVPTAGEPLDDIETQGGTTVEGVNAIGKQVIPTEEGMVGRVRRANDYLTGILAAAAVAAVVGCYLAVDVSNGFFWQGTAFAAAVGTVLCLRGRSHHDLVQSAMLIGGGLVIALAAIVKTAVSVDGWQVNSALALVALTVLVVLCGVVAPQSEFSPVLRRWVEIGEYVSIALVFPLACWIIRLYAFFRELRL